MILLLAVLIVVGFYGSKATWSGGPLSTAQNMRKILLCCRIYAVETGDFPYSDASSDDALLKMGYDSELGEVYFRFLKSKSGQEVDYWYLNKPKISELPDDTVLLVEKVPVLTDGILVGTKGGTVKLVKPVKVDTETDIKMLLGKTLSQLEK